MSKLTGIILALILLLTVSLTNFSQCFCSTCDMTKVESVTDDVSSSCCSQKAKTPKSTIESDCCSEMCLISSSLDIMLKPAKDSKQDLDDEHEQFQISQAEQFSHDFSKSVNQVRGSPPVTYLHNSPLYKLHCAFLC